MPVSMDLSRLTEVVLRELPVQDRAHRRGSISFPGFEAPSLTPLLFSVLGVSPLTPAGGIVSIGENTCLPACKLRRPGLWFSLPGAFSSTAQGLASCRILENMQASTDLSLLCPSLTHIFQPQPLLRAYYWLVPHACLPSPPHCPRG